MITISKGTRILNSVEQREIARNATEWMAGPYGLPKFPVRPTKSETE